MSRVRVVRSRAVRHLLTAFAICGFIAGVTAETASASDIKASRVTTTYDINFSGFNIGEFRLNANLDGSEYNLAATASISVLGGVLFEWKGKTTSSGHINRGPRPYGYTFGYRTADKGEDIDVKFSNNTVREIAVNPPQRSSGMRVPVTRQHMRNVIDPLSAALILSNVGSYKTGHSVCDQRMPIFDGKARYDLVLSYKRMKRVRTNLGYRGPAYVCKVKFIPIAGHRPSSTDSKYAARTEGMEIWLIPIKQAELYIPYYVHIPTPMGPASLTASNYDVTVDGRRRSAFRQ
jgi:hypothetical protein